MYTVVTNWRIAADTQADEPYRAFLLEAGNQVVPILREFGMLDVFVIRISPEIVTFVNIYEQQDEAELALTQVNEEAGEFLAQHVTLIERSGGETIDLPALFGQLPDR